MTPTPDVSEQERRVALVREHMRLENDYDFAGCIAAFGRPRYVVMATGETHDEGSGVEAFLLENRRAFPDFRFEPSHVTPAGESVLVEGVFSGTHLGPWRGLPATGRPISFPMAVIFEFDGDSLVCERLYFDLGTPLRQLGVSRDPTSVGGRLLTVVNHPVTIAKALARTVRAGRRRPAQP